MRARRSFSGLLCSLLSKFSASPAAGAPTRRASARAESGLLVLLITRAVARDAQVVAIRKAPEGTCNSWLGSRSRLFSAPVLFSPLIQGTGAPVQLG